VFGCKVNNFDSSSKKTSAYTGAKHALHRSGSQQMRRQSQMGTIARLVKPKGHSAHGKCKTMTPLARLQQKPVVDSTCCLSSTDSITVDLIAIELISGWISFSAIKLLVATGEKYIRSSEFFPNRAPCIHAWGSYYLYWEALFQLFKTIFV
jgi:hypothetical protein